MISNEGRAQLVNLRSNELESIIDLPIDKKAQRSTRFSAPELLKLALTQSDVKPTFESDVFAFAMTMLQVRELVLTAPFPEIL
jgi:hypothetical protein